MTPCQHYTAITHHDGYHYALCLKCGTLESLGPANMDVPEDEMMLAEFLASRLCREWLAEDVDGIAEAFAEAYAKAYAEGTR